MTCHEITDLIYRYVNVSDVLIALLRSLSLPDHDYANFSFVETWSSENLYRLGLKPM